MADIDDWSNLCLCVGGVKMELTGVDWRTAHVRPPCSKTRRTMGRVLEVFASNASLANTNTHTLPELENESFSQKLLDVCKLLVLKVSAGFVVLKARLTPGFSRFLCVRTHTHTHHTLSAYTPSSAVLTTNVHFSHYTLNTTVYIAFQSINCGWLGTGCI